jgi:hypothetical protein
MQEKTLGDLCHKVYALASEGIIALNANVVAAFSLRLGFFNLFLGRCLLDDFFLNYFFLVHNSMGGCTWQYCEKFLIASMSLSESLDVRVLPFFDCVFVPLAAASDFTDNLFG